jgi:hypothetical protein
MPVFDRLGKINEGNSDESQILLCKFDQVDLAIQGQRESPKLGIVVANVIIMIN